MKATSDGKVLPESIARASTPGTLNPIGDIGSMLSSPGIAFIVDAAQTVGLVPIHLATLPVDVL